MSVCVRVLVFFLNHTRVFFVVVDGAVVFCVLQVLRVPKNLHPITLRLSIDNF